MKRRKSRERGHGSCLWKEKSTERRNNEMRKDKNGEKEASYRKKQKTERTWLNRTKIG